MVNEHRTMLSIGRGHSAGDRVWLATVDRARREGLRRYEALLKTVAQNETPSRLHTQGAR